MEPTHPKYESKFATSELTSYDLRPTTLARSYEPDRSLSTEDTPVFRSVSSSYNSDLSPPTLWKSATSASTSSKIDSYQGPKKSSIEVSKSSYVPKEILVEPPTVPGGYLEPSYHVFSRVKPVPLLEAIVVFAKSNGLEFRVLPEKYKVKCVSYPLGESKVPFVASIFQMDSDKQGKRYAVEFQRRSGDILHFSDLWATCRRLFAEKGFIEKEKEIPKKFETPKLDDVTVTDKQIRETLQCLLQMASSSCCDVKCQAIAALSKMSTEEQVQKLMLEEACLDAFLTAAASKMEDIHRCAVYALANLAQSVSICQLIVEKGGVSVLCSLSHSPTGQVVRDCSRALGSIASRLGSTVVNDEFRETLQTLHCLPNPFAKQDTQHAAHQLEALHL